ncbi:hypothetical protein Bca4012_088316 [Brassica carinata]
MELTEREDTEGSRLGGENGGAATALLEAELPIMSNRSFLGLSLERDFWKRVILYYNATFVFVAACISVKKEYLK